MSLAARDMPLLPAPSNGLPLQAMVVLRMQQLLLQPLAGRACKAATGRCSKAAVLHIAW